MTTEFSSIMEQIVVPDSLSLSNPNASYRAAKKKSKEHFSKRKMVCNTYTYFLNHNSFS